jgi:DNA-binding transcriptional regulator YhcF (GntR family)
MRIISIISLIVAYALATVVCVCADVITSNSGVADTTSLQTRRLRGEVHVVRIRRPVDGSSISSDNESTFAEASAAASGDPIPPIRKRKHIPLDVEYASGILVNLKNAGNGDDAASSSGTRPNRQKQKDQLNLNDANAEKIAVESSAPRKTYKKSTDQERQDIMLFLRQRIKSEGSLPPGTINKAAEHFSRHRNTISRIYSQLNPYSADERSITDQERQDIKLFLRQRMNSERLYIHAATHDTIKHFGQHRRTIERIYKEMKPKSAMELGISDQERQDIVSFLSQRMNADGSLPYGTINEATKHFDRHWITIQRIYKKMNPI